MGEIILFLIFLIFIFYLGINLPKIKGRIGEGKVNDILGQLDASTYKIYKDLYIPTKNNGMTQIDHIVTSPYGIFVIETKHYKGWIFGSENIRYWTQVIYRRKSKFYNPIWQNAGHIKAIERYLKLDRNLFTSIIAFSNQSTFKFKEKFTRANVIHFSELLKTLYANQQFIINDYELQKINNALNKLIIVDKQQKRKVGREHVKMIRQKKQQNILCKEKRKCPRCNSDLIERSGRYGKFLGCSGFPKCRYTIEIN